MNRGHKQTDLIIMDFEKAFDNVPHRRLLHKLDYYGTTGKPKTDPTLVDLTSNFFVLCTNMKVYLFFGLVSCLTSQSTVMVMLGWSVHLMTFFLGKFDKAVNQYFVHILSLVTDNNLS